MASRTWDVVMVPRGVCTAQLELGEGRPEGEGEGDGDSESTGVLVCRFRFDVLIRCSSSHATSL